MRLCSKSASCSIMQSDTIVASIAGVFFKKAAMIIAIHGQKTLH